MANWTLAGKLIIHHLCTAHGPCLVYDVEHLENRRYRGKWPPFVMAPSFNLIIVTGGLGHFRANLSARALGLGLLSYAAFVCIGPGFHVFIHCRY
jgi:hypothetical protein